MKKLIFVLFIVLLIKNSSATTQEIPQIVQLVLNDAIINKEITKNVGIDTVTFSMVSVDNNCSCSNTYQFVNNSGKWVLMDYDNFTPTNGFIKHYKVRNNKVKAKLNFSKNNLIIKFKLDRDSENQSWRIQKRFIHYAFRYPVKKNSFIYWDFSS